MLYNWTIQYRMAPGVRCTREPWYYGMPVIFLYILAQIQDSIFSIIIRSCLIYQTQNLIIQQQMVLDNILWPQNRDTHQTVGKKPLDDEE